MAKQQRTMSPARALRLVEEIEALMTPGATQDGREAWRAQNLVKHLARFGITRGMPPQTMCRFENLEAGLRELIDQREGQGHDPALIESARAELAAIKFYFADLCAA
jgi:hypothetical protein